MKSILGRIHPPSILAGMAILLVVTGTAYAASQIDGSDVKNGSLTGKDVKNKSLTKADFKGSVRGAQGPQGAQGLQGNPGTPGAAGSGVAFAEVSSTGVFQPGASRNIVATSKGFAGYYCVNASVAVVHAVATLDNTANGQISVSKGDPFTSCPAGTDFAVNTYDLAGGSADKPFWVLFN